MAWTDEKKAQVIAKYVEIMNTEYKTDAERAAASVEVVAELASDFGEAVNGVRMVLSKANVYIKKGAGESAGATKTTTAARTSKADSAQALKNAIAAIDPELVDEEIISKLTGKAAAYFTTVLLKVE